MVDLNFCFFSRPLVQHKLNVLSKAGLGKDDFSEADNVKFEVWIHFIRGFFKLHRGLIS